MEKECRERLDDIASKFKTCRKAISAIGDETRQLILLALLESDFNGIINVISKPAHLYRRWCQPLKLFRRFYYR